MPAVLSRAARRFSASADLTIFTISSSVTRPSAFSSGPGSTPRLIHTGLPLAPRIPHWLREEIRVIVKEAVDAEMTGMRAACWDRYETLSSRFLAQADLASTRHSEVMTMHVKTHQRMGQVAFRVCAGMIGLAAASHYQGEISGMLTRIVGGAAADPPSPLDLSTAVKTEVDAAVKASIPTLVKLEIDRRNLIDLENKDNSGKLG